MPAKPFLFVFFNKAVNSSGTLPLPARERRCNKGHLPVTKFKEMTCHQASYHCIILIDRIYRRCLFFIADNNKWYSVCQFFNFFLKIRMGITCINDSLWIDRTDHPEIFFFLPCIPLSIADKNTVAFFICYGFDTL